MLHPPRAGKIPPVNQGGIFHSKEMFSAACFPLLGCSATSPPLRCPLECGFWGDLPCAFGRSSSEGSVRAPGVVGEQTGMCYGKRDLLKPAEPGGVHRGGFPAGREEPWCPARLPTVAVRLPWDCFSCCISHAAPWMVRGIGHLSHRQALHPM